jgi:hypothetical protein
MNPIEQKNHRTITATIARNVESIAVTTAARLNALDTASLFHSDELKRLAQRIEDERTYRLKLADERAARICGQCGRRSSPPVPVAALARFLGSPELAGHWPLMDAVLVVWGVVMFLACCFMRGAHSPKEWL